MPLAGGGGAGEPPVPAPSPQAAVRGTQTLLWAPSIVLPEMQARSAPHSSPFGHGAAQYESPPSWTQSPSVQSALVTQSVHELVVVVALASTTSLEAAAPFPEAQAERMAAHPTTSDATKVTACWR